MEHELEQPYLIAADLGRGKHDDFASRFFEEGLAELEIYLAAWAAYREFADDDG